MTKILTWVLSAALVAMGGTILLYIKGAEKAKARVAFLEERQANAERVAAACRADVFGLNNRIREINAATEQRIARERDRVATANAAAEEIRTERDRIAGQLQQSQRRFNEQLETEPDLREWVADAVPAPVWERLRSAAGY